MFIPLEEGSIVSLERVVALIREGDETAIYLRDGSVMATGFRPETLAKRHRSFRRRSEDMAARLRQEGDFA